MIKRFKTIVMLCPNAVTGGPEAIHQLRQILAGMGLDASILFYIEPDDIRIENGVLSHPSVAPGLAIGAYDHYDPVIVDRVALTPDTLVILPEVRTDLVPRLGPAAVAVWWLSVVNGFYPGGRLKEDEEFRKWFFGQTDIIHLCQTYNARRMLQWFGAYQAFDLVDYTDEIFTRTKAGGPNEGRAIAFNPAKGEPCASAFFAANPDLEPLPIAGMTKTQVLEALRRARIYVEFGENPGKDRMPREAACAGAVVLARIEGGSRMFGDTPIDPIHKFDNEAPANGRLAKTVRDILADPRPHWDMQAFYRHYLRTERELMQLQARQIFGL